MTGHYVGRFAPSPTGPLHDGSVLAALASWLDARAQGGRWLVRLEDVDRPRNVAGAAEQILRQLAKLGLTPDEAPVWQSQRSDLYRAALDRLISSGAAYPCACSRRDIEALLASRGGRRARDQELIYPGTCRNGLRGRPPRAWRFRIPVGADEPEQAAGPNDAETIGPAPALVAPALVAWTDRQLGLQQQDVASTVGDFVLLRADGLWAYQLAVVVDDAAQGISHVVRGEDLADNTPRQLLLQAALGLPHPVYLHTPLVLGADGNKLSKQNGAQSIDADAPLKVLNAAAVALGLTAQRGSPAEALTHWVREWGALYNLAQ